MNFLYDYQYDAVKKMHNGCILNGGVGSGKSRTGLYYYHTKNGGEMDPFKPMTNLQDLYIITTAMKRDTFEWDYEVINYHTKDFVNVVIDSWNNIKKYVDVKDAFFIFDEQRVVGKGTWAKSFLKIAKQNEWIMLSATPGDTWSDYIPVFLANGFYRNRTEFNNEHIVFSKFTSFPKIDRYLNQGRLIRLRNSILIDMDIDRKTIPHHEDLYFDYDIKKYKDVMKNRWDPYKNEPIETASELCYILRHICNENESRQIKLIELLEDHPRIIVFYNFDYELDILKKTMTGTDLEIAEWNGHAHQPVPTSNNWLYLVQYTAGCEGWNCITTDTIVFYSQNYSYKVMTQAAGRIDRLNTLYRDLYYYHFKSKSSIDIAISKAIKEKRDFNIRRFIF